MRLGPIAISLVVCLLFPITATASPAFQRPLVVGAAGEEQPAIAVDRDGNALAAWVERPGAIVAAFRPAGGSFGPPERIGSFGGYYQVGGPIVAFDSAGNASIAWGASDTDKIPVVHRSASGLYSAP